MLDQDEEDQFRQDLTALIPNLRAFARSLCRDAGDADDLAQAALLKAWKARESYTGGTNLKAWTFLILRNHFYSEHRRSWRTQQLDPEVAERTLQANDDQTATIALDEVRRALALLIDDQRDALILVGAGGMSYEDVAQVLGCPIGTIKSRVSRARAHLATLLSEGRVEADQIRPSQALSALMSQLHTLRTAAA